MWVYLGVTPINNNRSLQRNEYSGTEIEAKIIVYIKWLERDSNEPKSI